MVPDRSARRWATAVVTGASSGIGDAFARLLAADGTDLTLVARDRRRLDALAADLTASHGIAAEVVVADLTEPGDLELVAARVADPARPIQLLVNNAGFGTGGRFWELPLDGELAEVALNVAAVVRLTHAALGPMVARSGGAVLNVASIAGLTPGPGTAVYNATKAFVNSFGDSVHEELAGSGVTLTTLLPGFTRTEFQTRAELSDETDRIPAIAWMTAEAVAAAGLDGAAAGRARVTPGAGNRTVGAVLDLVPTSLVRRVMGVSMRRIAASRDA